MTRIIDNEAVKFSEILPEFLAEAKSIDVAVGYFNLRGYALLNEAIELKPDGEIAQILIGMSVDEESMFKHAQMIRGKRAQHPDDIDDLIQDKRKHQALIGFARQLSLGVPTQRDFDTLSSLKSHLRNGKTKVRLYTRKPLHGKAYILNLDSAVAPYVGFVGSSNLTLAGLSHNSELNVDVTDADGSKKLSEWFKKLWSDTWCVDITEDLLEVIEESWAADSQITPYELYLKLCYHLSQDAREAAAMYELPTEFDEKLLEYQKQAVKVLARRIDRNGGAILGDVVGLGKTLTAVATAALLGAENPRFTTLVVCPVNLEGMWDSILSFHKINFKVVPYSQVKKVLPELMRYDFVIFDESHYLRNHKTDHYTAISEYLAREQPKVLLLSATPLNTKFRDVANQLGLYIDDDKDMGFEPENALAASPASFNRMAGKLRTFAAFRLSNEALDWSRLLGDHMVRRTRTYIKKNYAQKDFKGEFLQFGDGSKFYFPKRESVVVEHSFGAEDPALAMASDDTLVQIENLVLPRNDLFKYVQENLFVTAEEIKILDRLRLSRSNLLGIARTSLYKRLSSGGFSFIVSLRRHLARNLAWIYAIENGFPVPIGAKSESSLDDFDDIDDEEDDYESEVENTQEQDFKIFGERAYKIIKSTAPKKMTWVDPSYFKTTLGEALRKDSEVISSLLENFGEWTFEGDSKLIKLVELIESDYKNKKVLIFTEYKDSAKYVNEGLKYFGVQKTEVVTSETKNPTNTARRFSPASNDFMVGPDVVEGTEINVLVTTDVLSEGQNLQDSHIVINFDLPWAIIKLVQRAGRVDRVGQKSDVIKVVSFVHESIDRVIKLRSAIRSRLGNVARAIGNDEVFLGDASEISDLDKLIAGSDEDKDVDVDVDAVSAAYEVWKRVANDDPVLANRIAEMPNALYSTRDSRPSDSHDLVSFSRTNSRVNLFTGSKRLEIASQERVKGISEIEALQHFFAHPDTPTMPRQNDHFELLSDAVDEMINQASNGYGKLDYVRRTLIASLSKSANRGVLEALDEIRQRPLTQTASTVLARALRSKRDKSALEAMILALSDDGELCLDLDEFDDSLELVLSLGIVK